MNENDTKGMVFGVIGSENQELAIALNQARMTRILQGQVSPIVVVAVSEVDKQQAGNGTGTPLDPESFMPENERTLTGGAVQPPPHAIDHD